VLWALSRIFHPHLRVQDCQPSYSSILRDKVCWFFWCRRLLKSLETWTDHIRLAFKIERLYGSGTGHTWSGSCRATMLDLAVGNPAIAQWTQMVVETRLQRRIASFRRLMFEEDCSIGARCKVNRLCSLLHAGAATPIVVFQLSRRTTN
jgi:hypothetical protein